MEIEPQHLKQLSRDINSTLGTHLGEFRKAATDGNKNVGSIAKDISKMFASQKRDMGNFHETLEETNQTSQRTATKIDNTNSILQESVALQNNILAELKGMNNSFKMLNNNIQNMNPNSIFDTIFNNSPLGKVLTGLETALGIGVLGMGANMAYNNVKDAEKKNAETIASLGGNSNQVGNTNFTAEENSAKQSAEKYLGRQIGNNEWKELVNATHAEAGQKNQTEVAMVMATMLNRARDKNKSVSDILREKSQFQSVTGTSANGNAPSSNFTQGPGEKRAEQIYGAATNILNQVSKQQKNFTAASSAAYGAGTNIGYRDKMISSGGSVVGASVFNTAAPTMSTQQTVASDNNQSSQQDATPQQGSMSGGGHGIISGAMGKGEEKEQKDNGSGLTSLKTNSGKSYQVASQYADRFKGFVDELESSGYKINSIGGYADRNIAGTNTKSWHSKGMAIDINPDANPVTYRGQPGAGKTNLPQNVGEMAAKYGLGWGGNWKNKLDTMHFSFGPNEGGDGDGSTNIGNKEKDKLQTGGSPKSGGSDATPESKAPATPSMSGTVSQDQPPAPQAPEAEQHGNADQQKSFVQGLAGMGGMGGGMGMPSGMMGMMGGMGGMGGGMGGMLGMLGPLLGGLGGMGGGMGGMAKLMSGGDQQASMNTAQLNASEVEKQLEESRTKEALVNHFRNQDKQSDERSVVQGNSAQLTVNDYNGPEDIGWPDWAKMLGGNHYEELKKIKLNMWG